MRYYESKTVTASYFKSKVCDICGKVSEGSHNDWTGSRLETIETPEELLKISEGTPDGGSYTIYTVDICDECMKNKIFPYIETLGAKITVTKGDW